MANFVYLVMEEKTREAMVIDSGWETGPILALSKDLGAGVRYAVATHGHFDHVSTLGEVSRELGAKVVAHEDSELECDVRVRDGDQLMLGKAEVNFLHTPGHTEDSICIYDGREVFTGDTLFVGTIGRFDRGSVEAMYDSLHRKILGLPPDTIIYPGHDYGEVKHRSLREEIGSNPFLSARDYRGFISLFS
jgi:hydroxyacylglutathione hydrolase